MKIELYTHLVFEEKESACGIIAVSTDKNGKCYRKYGYYLYDLPKSIACCQMVRLALASIKWKYRESSITIYNTENIEEAVKSFIKEYNPNTLNTDTKNSIYNNIATNIHSILPKWNPKYELTTGHKPEILNASAAAFEALRTKTSKHSKL